MASMCCGTCGEPIYEFEAGLIVRHQDITRLPDGRSRWTSRDFDGAVIHECAGEFAVVAQAERIVADEHAWRIEKARD